jgi:beta-1,4-mannosyltransferase
VRALAPAGRCRDRLACLSSAEWNPYLRLLYGHLAVNGLDVVGHGRLSLRWLWCHRRTVRFLHVHWPESLYRFQRGPSALRLPLSWPKLLLFGARLALARALGYRLVWTVHQVYPHETTSRPLDRLAARLLAMFCSVLLVHDQGTRTLARRALGRRPARRLELVPHGSYIGVYPPGRSREEVREELGIAPDAFVFLAFGELRRYKGVELLLEAFASLADDAAVLLVAGNPTQGEVGGALERAAGADRRIRLRLGFVPEERVAELFGACDAAVLARGDGGTSGSLILALSMGLPVVAAGAPAYHELLAGGEAGWLFAPGDPVALREALGLASSDPVEAARRAAAARAIAAALNWESIARRTALILRATDERPTPAPGRVEKRVTRPGNPATSPRGNKGMAATVDRSRLLGIEGARAIAASSILVYHVWLYGAPGSKPVDLGLATKLFDNLRAGVTLFFVLSGFLLFRPYVAAALRRTPPPSVRGYLRNRALRIVPAYWAILLFVGVVLERDLLAHPLQFLANGFLAQNYVPAYIYGDGIVPAWSLAIEVIFYLCVPVLGAAAIRLAARVPRLDTAAAFAPVIAMVAVGFGSKAALRVFDLNDVWGLSFLTHADWFAAGMALAVVRARWEDGRLTLPRYFRSGAVVSALICAVVAARLYYSGVLTGLEYQTPIALACALLLAQVVLAPPTARVVRVLTLRPLVAAGLASYSLFLWHDPLVRALRSGGLTLGGADGFVVNLLVIALLAGVGSTLTYRFVEKPALARKRAWQKPEKRAARESTERADEGGKLQPTPLPSATA